ncbi:MAG: CPBP family intramembrane metalloprotease [Planctomycetes bacterium]|nr:CPBP family intramembrane metalloprotease [Planctomycetota bacterium]
MSFYGRIRTIYVKELTDILRDRRTLIAMIVVPIVLYPLLMLGSIQAISYQTETLAQEDIIIGVLSESQGRWLYRLIEADAQAIEKNRQDLGPDSQEAKEELPFPLASADIRRFASQDEIQAQVRNRVIQVGVILNPNGPPQTTQEQTSVQFFLDKEDVRSASAYRRLVDLIERTTARIVAARKARAGLPDAFDHPFVVSDTDLSSPPSILGQILPLILVLMTITGAIYPAIDLTAGERERGTLESLMVSPVSVNDLIVGKFLVVTTVAILGAALNLASVTATVHFGGFDRMISTTSEGIPFGSMLFILLCLIPFAVLMSAVMIAVCSFARTFKEAQNYVTPVILAVLVPGGIAALPATRLEGIMLVMPVGNMVLLAREILLGAIVSFEQIAWVLVSTTFYAAAAVTVAASIFGQESVVFADAGSFGSLFSRRALKRSNKPTVSTVMLFTALLFPAWFFIQTALSPEPGESLGGLLYATSWLMPALFVGLPLLILLYWRIDVVGSLALRMPSGRHLAAGILIGLSAWVPVHELSVLQFQWLGAPESIRQSGEILKETLLSMPRGTMLLVVALIPAVCEELLFRGFLLSGLGSSMKKWTAILVSGLVFGVFHFFLFKFALTAALGIVFAYLCWQSRSILPVMIAHFLHNAIGVLLGLGAESGEDVASEAAWAHLPLYVLALGLLTLGIGLALASRRAEPPASRLLPAMAEA